MVAQFLMDPVVEKLKTDTKGFSQTKLCDKRKFYLFYFESSIVHQAGRQLENDTGDYKFEITEHDSNCSENKQGIL